MGATADPSLQTVAEAEPRARRVTGYPGHPRSHALRKHQLIGPESINATTLVGVTASRCSMERC